MSDPLFEEWRAYQKLVDNDYMDHRAFFGRLLTEVRQSFNRPLSVLDLGCGDAKPVEQLLRELDIRRYVGIDESATALGIARQRFDESSIAAELIEGDLVESLADVTGPFDLAIASFSLHHLVGPAAKQRAFEAVRKLLRPDGVLAVIDVFHLPGEPRPDYLERWIGFARDHYVALAEGEKELLFTHVRAHDYPESTATYEELGRAAGLPRFDVLLQDPARLNHLVTLRTDAS